MELMRGYDVLNRSSIQIEEFNQQPKVFSATKNQKSKTIATKNQTSESIAKKNQAINSTMAIYQKVLDVKFKIKNFHVQITLKIFCFKFLFEKVIEFDLSGVRKIIRWKNFLWKN